MCCRGHLSAQVELFNEALASLKVRSRLPTVMTAAVPQPVHLVVGYTSNQLVAHHLFHLHSVDVLCVYVSKRVLMWALLVALSQPNSNKRAQHTHSFVPSLIRLLASIY